MFDKRFISLFLASIFLISVAPISGADASGVGGNNSSINTSIVANFTAKTTAGFAPFNAVFVANCTGNVTNYTWNFGDLSGNVTTNNTTISHIYKKPGKYTVGLNASNNTTSNEITKKNYITALNKSSDDVDSNKKKPVAYFYANTTCGYCPLTVKFTHVVSCNKPNSYLWNFGDGTTSTHALTAIHTYKKAGKYTVKLTVTIDGKKYTKTYVNYIKVVAPKCKAANTTK